MLSAGNPYVLPSVLVAAAVYLALSFLTDLSVLIRIGVLGFIGFVVPVVLNRLFGSETEPAVGEEAETGESESPDEAGATAEESS